MKKTGMGWIAASALALGAALPMAASAQSTWNLYNSGTDGCTQNSGAGSNNGNFGNSWNCNKGTGNAGTTVSVSAYSNQYGSSGAGTLQTINGAGTYYANAYVSDWGSSGFGAANRTEGLGAGSPNHAVDNIPGGQWDGVLLNFGNASEVLTSIGLGWTYNSTADITVMRWTGSGSPVGSNSTVTTGGNSTLNGTGWTLVGSYKGLTGDSAAPFGGTARNTGAANSATSSWWLITAFNSTLNGGSSCLKSDGTTSTCDEGNDAFKLNYVSAKIGSGGGTPGTVPEPSSIALVALGLIGALGMRRRYAMR